MIDPIVYATWTLVALYLLFWLAEDGALEWIVRARALRPLVALLERIVTALASTFDRISHAIVTIIYRRTP